MGLFNRFLGITIIKASKLFNRCLYSVIEKYCSGAVLDIGGHMFFYDILARRPKLNYASWTTLEPDPGRLPPTDPSRHFAAVVGDGQRLQFAPDSFPTVLNIQVLEHVPHPELVMREIARVLAPGGHAVLVVPQTTPAHMIPLFYCNFSRYWMRSICAETGLRIVEERALGGLWRTMAYRHINFFLMLFRIQGFSSSEDKRGALFYLLLPLAMAYSLVSIPIDLLLSLADLTEDANNYLFVLTK